MPVGSLGGGVLLWGCGGNAGLSINSTCAGGSGPQIKGVVQMPRGRVAQAGDLWQRVAGSLWAEAAAITGAVSPVGRGVTVELVELRPEDAPDGSGGVVAVALTNQDGEFCVGLPEGTDQNVCRFVVQVGSSDDDTLTRAFVFNSDRPASTSTSAARRPYASFWRRSHPRGCASSRPTRSADIYDAVVAAPGRGDR